MGRIGRVVAGALVPLIAGVGLVACSGSDGELVITDDGDAEESLASAAETLAGTGRFRMSADFGDFGQMSQEGEFAGDDIAARMKFEPGEDIDPQEVDEDWGPTEIRLVGGVGYERRTPADDGWWRVPDHEVDESESALSFDQMAAILRGAEEVRQSGSDDLDGEPIRVFTGRISLARMNEMLGETDEPGSATQGEDAPDWSRIQRLQQLYEEAVTFDVTVTVDSADRLRRISLDSNSDLPASLEDCAYFEPMGSVFDMTIDLEVFDLGAEITIAAPDPATVTDRPSSGIEFDGDRIVSNESTLETSDGTLPRSVVRSLLLDAAGEELADLAPDEVSALSDADAVALYEQLKSARGGFVYAFEDAGDESEAPGLTEEAVGPTFETSDGDWTRGDLEAWVADDADRIGVDIAAIPEMSDQDLVAAYEKTLDLPGREDTDSFETDLFEGCPA